MSPFPDMNSKKQFSPVPTWDYAPAPETMPVNLRKQYELFIDGKFVEPSSGKYFASINPATGKKLTRIAHGTETDINAAVKSARRA